MTTESMIFAETQSPAVQAIRTVKAVMRNAGRCDGECRRCLPELLHECMALRPDLHRDAETPRISHT